MDHRAVTKLVRTIHNCTALNSRVLYKNVPHSSIQYSTVQYSTQSNSELWLTSHLRENEYSGRMRLPKKRHEILKDFTVFDGEYSVKIVTPQSRDQVKHFMLDNFYSIAPVPSALGLTVVL